MGPITEDSALGKVDAVLEAAVEALSRESREVTRLHVSQMLYQPGVRIPVNRLMLPFHIDGFQS